MLEVFIVAIGLNIAKLATFGVLLHHLRHLYFGKLNVRPFDALKENMPLDVMDW